MQFGKPPIQIRRLHLCLTKSAAYQAAEQQKKEEAAPRRVPLWYWNQERLHVEQAGNKVEERMERNNDPRDCRFILDRIVEIAHRATVTAGGTGGGSGTGA